MNWPLVARQHLRESWRRREFPAYVAAFAVIFGALGVFYARVFGPGGGPARFLPVPVYLTIPLVPVVGILLGGDVVAEPREDGRLRLVLGQPLSRTDVVVGGYVAKAAVLLATLLAAAFGLLAGSWLLGAGFPVPVLSRFTLLAAGLGLAYLGITIAAGTVLRTTGGTTTAKFGAFVVFVLFWRVVPRGVAYAANGFEPPSSPPPWVDLATGLSPSIAFEYLVDAFLEAENVPSGPTHFDDPAIYVGVLFVWAVFVPALATWRFNTTDL